MNKLSKSSGPATYHKAQVFKSKFGWLAACQEGCGGVKYVSGASQALMFKIAEGHMHKAHKPNDFGAAYVRSLINGR